MIKRMLIGIMLLLSVGVCGVESMNIDCNGYDLFSMREYVRATVEESGRYVTMNAKEKYALLKGVKSARYFREVVEEHQGRQQEILENPLEAKYIWTLWGLIESEIDLALEVVRKRMKGEVADDRAYLEMRDNSQNRIDMMVEYYEEQEKLVTK